MRAVLAAAIGIALVATLAFAAPASAADLAPVADRYEPGQVATLVGYADPGSPGWAEDGPFRVYLSPASGEGPQLPLGELTLAETGHEGWRAVRASISFPIPDDLEPGLYTVAHCNASCTTGLGDLQAGAVAVGVDTEAPAVRTWSLDEPEIANAPADAVIAGPGYEATVAVIRAGELLRQEAPSPPAPPVTTVPAPPAPTVTVITVVAPPPPSPAPAAPVNGGWLVFGSGLAAACVLSVLIALRQGAAPVASRRLAPS